MKISKKTKGWFRVLNRIILDCKHAKKNFLFIEDFCQVNWKFNTLSSREYQKIFPLKIIKTLFFIQLVYIYIFYSAYLISNAIYEKLPGGSVACNFVFCVLLNKLTINMQKFSYSLLSFSSLGMMGTISPFLGSPDISSPTSKPGNSWIPYNYKYIIFLG